MTRLICKGPVTDTAMLIPRAEGPGLPWAWLRSSHINLVPTSTLPVTPSVQPQGLVIVLDLPLLPSTWVTSLC